MADSFSLEQTLAYLQSLFDIGERAAGTQEECVRARTVFPKNNAYRVDNIDYLNSDWHSNQKS